MVQVCRQFVIKVGVFSGLWFVKVVVVCDGRCGALGCNCNGGSLVFSGCVVDPCMPIFEEQKMK